jgi:hypothetical protein
VWTGTKAVAAERRLPSIEDGRNGQHAGANNREGRGVGAGHTHDTNDRAAIGIVNRTDVSNSNQPQKQPDSLSKQWVPGPTSLLSTSAEISWELLINNILKSISDLNYSAKNEIKSRYLSEANQIVRVNML